MSNQTAFAEMKKAQDILAEAIDKSAKTNLEAVEKLMELNKQRFSEMGDFSNPSDFVSRQSAAFKDYVDFLSGHVEALTAIGNDSREQLTELSQEFAKGLDFSSFFPFADTGTTKTKAKSTAKSS
ncbi:MAG: phasin family protein [Wenzhouxiangella sp.]|nr:phasin family protein [Wenzhouxiangella sp.]MCH8478771.1 phasin family protein [Wenzhouxiangella sp.]